MMLCGRRANGGLIARPDRGYISATHFVEALGWTGMTSGAAAAVTLQPGEAGHPGIARCYTGTDANGAAWLGSGSLTGVLLGGGPWEFRALVRVPVLSDDNDRFKVHVGFQNYVSGGGTGFVMFRYTHSVNAGRWQCRTGIPEESTIVDTDIAVVAATWYDLRILVPAAVNVAHFWIDGTLMASIETTLPSGEPLGYAIHIGKTLGTTGRSIEGDWGVVRQRLAA